jgi:hypothetical protein
MTLSGERKACAALRRKGRSAMIIKGIDEIDNQLVDLLLQDGRMSY